MATTDSGLNEHARRYLDERRVARLATADAEGRPTVVPVCYALAGDGSAIYTPLDAKPKRVAPTALKRVRNLRQRPDCCLVVDDYSDDWSHLSHLIVWSKADLLDPGTPEHVRAVALLRHRYVQYRSMPIDEQPVIRLRPERARFWAMAPDPGP